MKNILILCLFLLFYSVTAQNLVPNGDFEEYSKCPEKYIAKNIEVYNILKGTWYSASKGTPDYYNENCNEIMGAPINWAGTRSPQSGKGYSGFYIWRVGNENYREYLEAKLIDSLRKGITYKVKFYYASASKFPYYVSSIGVYFSKENIYWGNFEPIPLTPHLKTSLKVDSLKNIHNWQEFTANYKATGRERFIVIGNFLKNEETPSYRIPGVPNEGKYIENRSYFYIDNISVTPPININKPKTLITKNDPPTIRVELPALDSFSNVELNKVFILKNVFFDFDKWDLLPASFPYLLKLVDYLKQEADLHITITGHTDNIGEAPYNMFLSLHRSESVSSYLQSKGIDVSRIICKGFGSERPLNTANTPEARSENRRVEIKFYKIETP